MPHSQYIQSQAKFLQHTFPCGMSPLAAPASTLLTGPMPVTMVDLLPRESSAPVFSGFATFTCSPSAALHDVAILVPLVVLSTLVVLLIIINLAALYLWCRNRRQKSQKRENTEGLSGMSVVRCSDQMLSQSGVSQGSVAL